MKPLPRVLVVDDDDDHRFITSDSLQRWDGPRFRLEQARNGAEALEKLNVLLAQEVPVLVLSDYRMPNMNGLALAEQIRVRYPGARVRFVLFTTMEQLPPSLDAPKQTVEMLVKPLGLAQFRQSLRGLVGGWLTQS